jgi:hypothetical protein
MPRSTRSICRRVSTRLKRKLKTNGSNIIRARDFYYYQDCEEAARIHQHDTGETIFLPNPKTPGLTKLLHEIADVGVQILQGTSLGILLLKAEIKQKLARHLGLTLE